MRERVAAMVDLSIAIYAVGLVTIFVTGGVDLGLISLQKAEKPILFLLILIPIRLALGGRDRMLERAGRQAARLAPLWTTALGWVRASPAVTDVAFTLLVTRAATFSIGFIANLLYASSNVRAFHMPFRTEKFAEIFAAWDSGWYFGIARQGYSYSPDGQSSIAFFPLYPLLMRAGGWVLGGSDKALWTAGILISCAAFALALVELHRFTERVFGDRLIARRAVLYLAIFPFSLFFTRVYAESVFLLTSLLAVTRAYDGKWWRAGMWAGLATITRPNGILIGLPLALMAMQGRPGVAALARRCAALSLVPATLLGHCAYVYTITGDPLAWLSAQKHWDYSLWNPPWQQLLKMIGRLVKYGFYDYFFVSPMAPYRLFHGLTALVFLALLPAIFKRLGAAMGAYVLVSLLVPLSGSALEGVGRYSAVLFPAFMILGTTKSSRAHEAILMTSTLLLALFVCLFVTGRPIF